RNSWGRLFLGIVPLICIGLGSWQVYRLRWKEEIIAKADAVQALPVVALPKEVSSDVEQLVKDWEYRRVLLVGYLCHDEEMLVGPRAFEGENGFMVVTPLVREDGSKVLVKRGWIPKTKADPATRPESRRTDLYTIFGLVRQGEAENAFTPRNHPDRNQWFVTNTTEMAAHTHALPILVEEIYDPRRSPPSKILMERGIPLGRSEAVTFRNNHMQYIVTWYALAAFTAVMYGVLV
ncbi:SURF1 family-domain-containing protein, partial [Dimargaris cristalligena]